MRTPRGLLLASLLFFTLIQTAPAAPGDPVVISVDFGLDLSSQMAQSETAGVFAVTNWNSVSNATGTAALLRNDFGVATSAGVSWNCPNTWSVAIANTAGNYRMMKGYLDTTPTVTVTNLPASFSTMGYDVLVYCDGDNGGNFRVGKYTLNATSIYLQDAPNANFAGTFTRANGASDQGTNTPAGNYVRFTGLTNSSFTVTGTPGTFAGAARAPINGLQIVQSMAPPVISLASTNICQGSDEDQAVGPAGMAGYSWTVTNAVVEYDTDHSQTLVYAPGPESGYVGLTLTVTNAYGQTSTSSTNVFISSPPGGGIFCPTLCANSTGNVASAFSAGPGYTYQWTVTGATVSGPTNLQTITFNVGATGTVGLGLLVLNAAGCGSGDYTESTIQTLPVATISASATVYSLSTTNSASGPAGASSYAWSITNGVITSDANVQVITFTAGSTGNVGLSLTVGNNVGCTATTSTNVVINSAPSAVNVDPLTNSWMTTYAGQYARIYTTDLNRTNGAAVTTWSIGSTTQALPAYCGVQEVYSSSNWVYVRTTGLAGYVMGAWYTAADHANLLQQYPINQKLLYRIPRTNTVPATKTLSGGGPIGIGVDGVAAYNVWDAYVWNGSTEATSNTNGYWNRDAYVNEGTSVDPANAHQPPSGQYHFHDNPMALRYQMGDHVDLDPITKIYSESPATPTKHSPILGWAADGFPIYGPYGYSLSNDASSGIRRMISGYVLRDGQYGTSNLTANGRTTIPAWATRLYNVASNILAGPPVSTTYPLGRYIEDNDFLGDHGIAAGTNTYDLDQYNGRWCVTPEFPNGTYAYFITISSNGTPVYPYMIGFAFYGAPSGGAVSVITETVETNFLGNTNLTSTLNTPTATNTTVTLTWSAVEGGSYQVEGTPDFTGWTLIQGGISPNKITGTYSGSASSPAKFYRVGRTSVANFDSAGTTTIATPAVAPGGSATRGQTIYLTITLPSTPPNPPAGQKVSSVTVGSITASSATCTTQGTVQAVVTIPANATTGTQNVVVIFQNGPTYTLTGGFTVN